MVVRIFLSTVSDEFRAYRDQLRGDLTRHNVEVKVQEDFKDSGTVTLDMVDRYISNCDAVVHLVGDMTGSNAKPASTQAILAKYPDLLEKLPPLRLPLEQGINIPYTQWEAWLAVYHGKALLIAKAEETAPRGPKYVPSDASRASQQTHLERLGAVERHPRMFTGPDDLAKQIAYGTILDLLAKEQSGPPVRQPGDAISNIPIRVPMHFMGRDDALIAIDTALKRSNGRVAIAVLYGLRGVGKTTLAAAYAEEHRGDYRATWWIRAQAESSMRADLIALGVRLGWVRAVEKEPPPVEAVMQRLSRDADEADAKELLAVEAVMQRLPQDGDGILLVFDNAMDASAIKPYLPRGGTARVLVTSNSHAWRGVAEPVEIRIWPKEIGADYLMARTGRAADRDAAEALSQALGGLPLAHEQAGAYCERLGISLADYRKRFEATPARLLDNARDAPAEYHEGLTVAKTFALAIQEAAKLHPAAEPLIVHAALLAPAPIPLFLFMDAREKLGEPLASMLANDGLDETVAALRAFGLVEREAIIDERDASITIDAIRVHRLIREVAAAQCEGGARDQLRRALVAALDTVYPEGTYDNPPSRCAPLTPHLLVICGTKMADAVANAESIHVLEVAALARSHAGKPTEAIALLEVLIDTFGPTPERLGFLGGKYKGLIGVATTSDEKLRYVEKSIQCYERGIDLDPNSYYCSSNLPALYRQRNRNGDEEREQTVLQNAIAACERAKRYGSTDEWLRPTLLAAVFDAGDADRAEELSDEIAAEGLARWKIDLLLDYLDASIERIKDSHLRLRLCAVIRRFRSVLPPTAS